MGRFHGWASEAVRREKLTAWGVSLLIHAVLFCVLAVTGVFAFLSTAEKDEDEPVDVVMLDDLAGGAAGPAASGEAPAAGGPAGTGVSSAIALPSPEETAHLPEIREDYTRTPARQEEYREQHQQSETEGRGKDAASGPVGAGDGRSSAGPGDKGSAGTGTGGAGQGSGDAGTGSGAGSGAGTGNSNEVVAAVCIYRAPAQYPPSLIDEEAEGSVTLLMEIGRDNSVNSVSVIRSSGYRAMDRAAIQAAYNCRFQTYGQRGRFTITYSFRLN